VASPADGDRSVGSLIELPSRSAAYSKKPLPSIPGNPERDRRIRRDPSTLFFLGRFALSRNQRNSSGGLQSSDGKHVNED